MTYIQLAKTIVVVACLVLACDWTPCVPLIIQVLCVFSIVTQVHFINALKISWLKRLINQTKGWAEFPIKNGINELLRYGDGYPKQIIMKITNKFWRDVVLSIIEFNNATNQEKKYIQYMPLWHNSSIKIEYRKEWEKKVTTLLRIY